MSSERKAPPDIGGAPARIDGGRVLTPQGWVLGNVFIENGAITGVEPRASREDVGKAPLDASGLLVVPGFIDLQINGGFGHDFTSRPEAIWEVGALLPRYGVTSFVPTIVSSPLSIAQRALDALASGPPAGYLGATPLGFHFEGPMLASSRRGAHDGRYLLPPSLSVVERWSRSTGARMVTLAPELRGGEEVVRALVKSGTIVSAGHSDATFDEAVRGFDSGITCGTHLFNAMSGLDHREPGLAAALLARVDVVAGLIADGVHVHPGAVAAAWRAKGPKGIALVTDAVAAMGLDAGTVTLGESVITIQDGAPRNRSGTLAGSLLSLDVALKNFATYTGCERGEAVATVTSTPARVLGEPRKGVIESGADADVVLLDPDLGIVAALVDGRLLLDRRDGEGPSTTPSPSIRSR